MGRFNPLVTLLKDAEHRSLGAQYRARMERTSGPGFASVEPMNVYGNSRLESGGFCALSPVTISGRVSANESGQTGPQQAARDHRRQGEVV
jgi:hypothetical protein